MLSLEPWQTRLQDALAASVELAANMDAVRNGAMPLPSVTLVPGRERVSHQERHPRTHHRVTAEVMAVSGVARYGSARFGEGQDQLAELRRPVLASLIHWQAPGIDNPIRWTGGQLLTLSDHALFWVDVFAAEYWWQEETP